MPSIEVGLTLINTYDRLLTGLELDRIQTAKAHEAQTFYRARSSPGIGKLLALVRLSAIHAIRRFPRVQEFASYGRLVNCAQTFAGKRSGTSGKKLGHADLTWAFSDTTVLFLWNNPAGQKYRARIEKKHGQGNA